MSRTNACAVGVQLQISVPKQTYIFSADTLFLWYSVKRHIRGVSEVICAQRHTTTYVVRHTVIQESIQDGYFCPRPPKQSHKRSRDQSRSQAITLFQSELKRRIGNHTQTVLANRIPCKNATDHEVKINVYVFRKLDLTRTSLYAKEAKIENVVFQL